MKRLLLLMSFIMQVCIISFAQGNKYGGYYYQRVSIFEKMAKAGKGIVLMGDSITDGGEWSTIFENPNIYNYGISGDISAGVLDRISPVIKAKPKKFFLMIGINDLARGISPDSILANVEKTTDLLKQGSPQTKIFIQSVLPVNKNLGQFGSHTNKEVEIKQLNEKYKELCIRKGYTFIDLYSHFKMDDSELLNPKYTNDGLHLLGDGYLQWCFLIRKYVK